MFSSASVQQVQKDIKSHIAAAGNYGDGTESTSVVTALLSKSDEYATHMLHHPAFHGVINHFLTENIGPCQVTRGQQASVTIPPQIDSTVAAVVHPGGEPHNLHRDDVDRFNVQPFVPKYEMGRDTNVAMLTALDATTRANGATRVLPGSHLWDYNTLMPLPDDERLVDAILNPGDSLLLLGCTLHGAGANTTDASRAITACFVTRGRLRQMENQYLAHDLDKVRQFPLWLKRLMGFSVIAPACGWIDKKDPLRKIDPHAGEFIDIWDPSAMKFH
ncbi:hypothetical protein PDE_00792 [Penicillium oxalicum 114-2]|uniref:Phytanoyl-CoA dioxygenase n=1 Tax=Penicillium oxalicum (strain 114-2 / CGMCC 5302) TaxID=933388 RepID=S7ZB16_PENO1|nr:hypothetical protein PDE_00792 [Penicillium oxalicum 114-2]